MNKNKKGYLIYITLLLCLFSSSWLYSQDTTYTNKFLGRWVVYSGDNQKEIIYVPYNSPLSVDLSPELKYAGLTFEKGHRYLQHRWQKCGNDKEPDVYEGKWSLRRSKDQNILSITDFNKVTKTYFVLEIESSKMVLVPAQ